MIFERPHNILIWMMRRSIIRKQTILDKSDHWGWHCSVLYYIIINNILVMLIYCQYIILSIYYISQAAHNNNRGTLLHLFFIYEILLDILCRFLLHFFICFYLEKEIIEAEMAKSLQLASAICQTCHFNLIFFILTWLTTQPFWANNQFKFY